MTATIRPVCDRDWASVAEIFNHYVNSSPAAYPDEPVDQSTFRDRQLDNPGFPFIVADIEGRVVGFAFLSPFHSASTMQHSATVTYFLHPDHTGQGVGSALLKFLLDSSASQGITNILAHVSSLNPGSIRFHLNHGFTQCGRFVDVGIKNNQAFDMVWLQKLQR